MDDLINRQDAIDKFKPWLKIKGYSEGELNMLKAVLYELTFMPSAQLERKKGEWIHREGGYSDHYECSACGQPIVLTGKWNYCPMCGADMRGEEE